MTFMNSTKRVAGWRASCLAFLATTVLGCSGEDTAAQYTIVVQPEAIRVDGGEWTKQEWSTKLDSKISRHFAKSPHLAETPSLSGTTVCYANGSKQRVYWLSVLDQSCQWAMLEFSGNRGGELIEGRGEPFIELALQTP